jgi:UDP-N-acetylglucosamine 2-epimerase (non-hydrolysing)
MWAANTAVCIWIGFSVLVLVTRRTKDMVKILNVVGARPNFMKMAPIVAAIARRPAELSQLLVHTGQHYDETMSASFFRELKIPAPDVNLEVGSGTHAEQTARVMLAFEPVLVGERPDWVVVVGDVNSTLACALVAAKLCIRVAHVEAGLRSFDWTMPEEVNRVLTDRMASLLFTPSEDGDANLKREGIDADRIVRVGNVMIDTLMRQLEDSRRSRVLDDLDLRPGSFAALTMHRPSNVDDPTALRGILTALGDVAQELPIIFPAHPRTRARMREFGIAAPANVRLLEPMGYVDFLRLWSNARLVLTDSGGLQEETTALGIPCLTLRENTERPITVEQGTNRVVGSDPERIRNAVRSILRGEETRARRVPELWDGRAAERIVEALIARS